MSSHPEDLLIELPSSAESQTISVFSLRKLRNLRFALMFQLALLAMVAYFYAYNLARSIPLEWEAAINGATYVRSEMAVAFYPGDTPNQWRDWFAVILGLGMWIGLLVLSLQSAMRIAAALFGHRGYVPASPFRGDFFGDPSVTGRKLNWLFGAGLFSFAFILFTGLVKIFTAWTGLNGLGASSVEVWQPLVTSISAELRDAALIFLFGVIGLFVSVYVLGQSDVFDHFHVELHGAAINFRGSAQIHAVQGLLRENRSTDTVDFPKRTAEQLKLARTLSNSVEIASIVGWSAIIVWSIASLPLWHTTKKQPAQTVPADVVAKPAPTPATPLAEVILAPPAPVVPQFTPPSPPPPVREPTYGQSVRCVLLAQTYAARNPNVFSNYDLPAVAEKARIAGYAAAERLDPRPDFDRAVIDGKVTILFQMEPDAESKAAVTEFEAACDPFL